jgi:hypothetical protein
MGGEHAFTPLHYDDGPPNLHAMVSGSARVYPADDYARALRSKYRRRLRGLRASAAHVERRRIDAATACTHAPTIEALLAAALRHQLVELGQEQAPHEEELRAVR